MKIEITIKIDERTQHPYWNAELKEGDNNVMQVVSQTFNGRDDKAFQDRYENCTVRFIKELLKMKQKDQNMIKYLLTQTEKV